MNRSALKNYAPKARRAFIQAVTDRAIFFGLTAKKTEPITEQGDVAIIGGKAFPRSVVEKRKRLEERIERKGFAQTMEAAAYTWFNRLVAIRYMELHGYLGHGYRVLSHPEPDATTPEILQQAEHVELPGLNRDEVIELKLDGGKESELYRKLLIAQCNALHQAMPFLFERIDDETELLLPDNLLHSDSLVRTLVASIDESDWQEVEIIGWLYQFYISEKKDQVIGKVVKSEDIPAATQLFTPNWIVKYLVQNSLGRQWIATYPDSPLKAKMEYYIEPAEQTPEVQAKLDEITPDSLNPEELTLLDPACGSGHILVEAYDLLKDIYLERGYRLRDIPALILEKNLFGLEIDDRAAQLAAFALMMKARADDRRIFDGQHQPNVLSIQESNGLDINNIVQAFTAKRVTDENFASPGEFGFMTRVRAPLFAGEAPITVGDDQIATDLKALLHLFEDAKTYGSLITIPEGLTKRLPALTAAVGKALASADMMIQRAGQVANVFVSQATLLAAQYDAVVANPPYMSGRTGMSPALKSYVEGFDEDTKADLFASFIRRGFLLLGPSGRNAMVTMQSWMFLPSFTGMRTGLLRAHPVQSMCHMDTGVMGIAFGTAATVWTRQSIPKLKAHFCYVSQDLVGVESRPNAFPPVGRRSLHRRNDFFDLIPERRYAYWISDAVADAFRSGRNIESVAPVRQGFQTGDNDRFLRYWHEVDFSLLRLTATCKEDVFSSGGRWVPYNKGGAFRKWYGNNEFVVAFDEASYNVLLESGNKLPSRHLYFRQALTWSALSSGHFGARHSPAGFTFSAKGACAFPENKWHYSVLALLNSKVAVAMLEFLAATMDYNVGSLRQIPFALTEGKTQEVIENNTKWLVSAARQSWDASQESWDYSGWSDARGKGLLVQVFREKAEAFESLRQKTEQLEEETNALLTGVYGLDAEIDPSVPADEITLRVPSYSELACDLASFAVGCAMGRYSLDEPGLIYAHSGNEGFDPNRYKTFPTDADGIVPLTEFDWFEDDAARRFEEFIAVAWPKEHLEENLAFVAENLGPKKNEHPRDTIRRYFAKSFFKDHLKSYKNRPIYWLFSSGKQGAFQALVYLHRYNEGTLARMRTEYVIPLQGKISARIQQLEGDKAKATSASHRNRIQKEQDTLRKQQDELRTFDEKLRHYADQRIALDLDDGVKVNYAKFGDLLAEVKAVCGKTEGDD